MNKTPEPLYYFLILVEVVFKTSDGVAVLKRQLFEKGFIQEFPAHRIHRINNIACLQIKQSLPQELQESFQALDAVVLGIIPLGCMTEDQFWAGMNPPSSRGDDVAPVADDETETGDNSNIHRLPPRPLTTAVNAALQEPVSPSMDDASNNGILVDDSGLEATQEGPYGEDDIPGTE